MFERHSLSNLDQQGAAATPLASRSSTLVWIAACLLATIAVSLVAAQAPPRIRLIGIFPVMLGLLIGGLVVWLAEKLDAVASRRFQVVAAMLLAVGGWGGLTWETFRRDEVLSVKSANQELAARLMKEFEQQTNTPHLELDRPTTVKAFRAYLARRVQQLGDWSRPWPELFWGLELVMTGVAAGWVSTRAGWSAAEISTEHIAKVAE
jgi:xanthosine utilization system XapX-like protein